MWSRSILRPNGVISPAQVDFLSLDVEGSEEQVLTTVNITRFSVLMVEQDKANPTRRNAVPSHVRCGLLNDEALEGAHERRVCSKEPFVRVAP